LELRSRARVSGVTVSTDELAAALGRIRSWGESRDWVGWDPYDGLNSPLAPLLSLGTCQGRRVVTQLVKRSPVNLRPALLIRPQANAKAIGLVVAGYAKLASAGDEAAVAEARRWAAWLAARRSQGSDGWGYHFPVQTRIFSYDRYEPNTIATTFVIQGLFDAAAAGVAEAMEPAVAACLYLREALLRVDGDSCYFRYLEGRDELVHNANLLACAALARAAAVTGDAAIAAPVPAAVATTLRAQRPDGSWPYAASAAHSWVDNFHTGYVLESLASCLDVVPDAGEALDAGVRYWRRELFLTDGRPRYDARSTYPLDAHCYAQAIDTNLALWERDPDAPAAAVQSAELLVRDFTRPGGFIGFQRGRFVRNNVAFIRWTNAPSFRALAGLVTKAGR
jgi:polysaccharide biosynthesis protein VpsJ